MHGYLLPQTMELSMTRQDEIDLSKIEPLIARPSSPGNVVTVHEVAGIKVDQVIVGSSVNSSFRT